MGDKISTKLAVHVSGANLQHGKRSKYFSEFCKKYGLNSDIDQVDLNFFDKLKYKIALVKECEVQRQALVAMFKDTGARGLSVLGDLMDIHTKILQREQYCSQTGIDPLTDRALIKAYELKLEMTKFLERIKWDKEKSEMEYATKKLGKTSDIDFVIVNDELSD